MTIQTLIKRHGSHGFHFEESGRIKSLDHSWLDLWRHQFNYWQLTFTSHPKKMTFHLQHLLQFKLANIIKKEKTYLAQNHRLTSTSRNAAFGMNHVRFYQCHHLSWFGMLIVLVWSVLKRIVIYVFDGCLFVYFIIIPKSIHTTNLKVIIIFYQRRAQKLF